MSLGQGFSSGSLEASSEIHRACSPVRTEYLVPGLLCPGRPCPWPENGPSLDGCVSAGWGGRREAAVLGCVLVQGEARSYLKREE